MNAMGWTLPVLKRDRAFASSERIRFIPTAPDQLWATDITYVWCYLFNILDCFTRERVAYVFARDMRRQHAIDCLFNATEGRDLFNLVLRPDNGSQFSSSAFMVSVKALGMSQEFIANSTPEQQGHVESFHSTLKNEYIRSMEFGSYCEAAEYLPQVFGDYNNARLHSAISYSTLGEFYLKCKEQLVPEVVTSNPKSRK
jgi:putative transposase